MRKALKKAALVVACASGLAATMQVEAANWLMLQGTERPSAAGRAKVWGFLQPTYSSTKGSEIPTAAWRGSNAQFNQMPPQLSTNKGFEIRRARIGVRGQGFPLDPNVNYFFLAEFGSNGITWPKGGGGSAKIDHASVTLNHIKGARVRVGLFKTPMSEEVYQGIHVFDYINFTNFGFTQLLERFFDNDGSGSFAFNPAQRPVAGPPGPNNKIPVQMAGGANTPNGPVGAVRDIGLQVFDTFKTGNWDTSYAFMLGNGNGINRSDNNTSLDRYVYFSTEKVYAGRGPRVQSLKLYAWSISGKRELDANFTCADFTDSASCGFTRDTFDRKRSGIGMTFRKGKYRAAAEILRADGMIFAGTDGGAVVGSTGTLPGKFGNGDGNLTSATNIVTVPASLNVQENEKADAYYVHFGYAVTRALELDIRHDVMNRGTVVAANERKFTTTTLGLQWFFNLKTRAVINYEIRKAEAPNLPSTDNANVILNEMDNRLSFQITSIF